MLVRLAYKQLLTSNLEEICLSVLRLWPNIARGLVDEVTLSENIALLIINKSYISVQKKR